MSALKSFAFAVAACTLMAGAAQAQDCPAGPEFVGVNSANADVRNSEDRLERGDWRIAEHFAREAIGSGTASRNKAAAYINLCAALANQRSDDTMDVCNEAVTRSESRWEAYTNRGAAYWLAGDQDAARADFETAAELGDGESAVAANLALASCTA